MTTESAPEEPENVIVPRFLGLRVERAKRLARRLDIDLATQIYNDGGTLRFGIKRVASNKPPDTIVWQSVGPREELRDGWELRLLVAATAPESCSSFYPEVCIRPYFLQTWIARRSRIRTSVSWAATHTTSIGKATASAAKRDSADLYLLTWAARRQPSTSSVWTWWRSASPWAFRTLRCTV